MATAAAAKAAGPKEFTFLWEGKDKAGKTVRGEMRAAGENMVNASLRRQGIVVAKVKKQRLKGGGTVTEKDVALFYPPDGHHDEGRRAAAAGLRHRQQGRDQSCRGEVADRYQDRGRDRLVARPGVSQVPAVLRRAVLQPGAGGRGGRHSRKPARSPGDLQGKDARHQVEDQVGAVLPRFDHCRRHRDHRGDHDFRGSRRSRACSPVSAPTCPRRPWW